MNPEELRGLLLRTLVRLTPNELDFLRELYRSTGISELRLPGMWLQRPTFQFQIGYRARLLPGQRSDHIAEKALLWELLWRTAPWLDDDWFGEDVFPSFSNPFFEILPLVTIESLPPDAGVLLTTAMNVERDSRWPNADRDVLAATTRAVNSDDLSSANHPSDIARIYVSRLFLRGEINGLMAILDATFRSYPPDTSAWIGGSSALAKYLDELLPLQLFAFTRLRGLRHVDAFLDFCARLGMEWLRRRDVDIAAWNRVASIFPAISGSGRSMRTRVQVVSAALHNLRNNIDDASVRGAP